MPPRSCPTTGSASGRHAKTRTCTSRGGPGSRRSDRIVIMAGGYTYMEVVEQQEHYRLRQQGMADLRRLLARDYGDNSWLESATYEELCQAKEGGKEAERQTGGG